MCESDLLSPSHRSAYVAIVGLPNAGKSTLLNRFLGQDLAIMSPKPQTTRNQIVGVLNRENTQLIFLDTPGFYEGRMKVDGFYRQEIRKSLEDADIILLVIDGRKPGLGRGREFFRTVLEGARDKPVIIVLNKLDALKQSTLIPLLGELPERFTGAREFVPVSARDGQNLEELLKVMDTFVEEGPQFYPEEMITDRDNGFLIAEFVREALFIQNEEEVPFAVAVAVDRLEEMESRIEAEVLIYVEREGQKAILIGEGGQALKSANARASMRARRFFGRKVQLTLWIKVKPGWRQNERILKQVGLA